jgi:hypothetical protein
MRTGWLSGSWLAALLTIGLTALLIPGVGPVVMSSATASQASPAAATATTDAGCRGVTPAVIPALGFITNPDRTQRRCASPRTSPSGCRACTSAREPTEGRLAAPGTPVRYGRRRSAAPPTLAMITANGGITKATTETTIAAIIE